MQDKGELYTITVKEAEKIASQHEMDDNWDFWAMAKRETESKRNGGKEA